MKVIAKDKTSSTKYIVEISHDEISKVMNKSTWRSDDKLPELNTGEDFNLAEGHDFREEITRAVTQMQEAYKGFAKASDCLQRFAGLKD